MNIDHPHVKKVTYADYLTWPDQPRYEIIEGIPYMLYASCTLAKTPTFCYSING